MRVLGLDLSLHTGWAVLDDGKLVDCALIEPVRMESSSLDDINTVLTALNLASSLGRLIEQFQPDVIAIEQTNAGKFRSSQKVLEFLHCCILQMIHLKKMDSKVIYLDTSAWRKGLGIKLSVDQRLHNKELKRRKKRATSGNGKITWKHLSVAWVNQKFGLKLKLVNNDVADAICLASYGAIKSVQNAKEQPNFDVGLFK